MMFHCGEPYCAGWAVDSQEADLARKQPQRFIPSDVIQGELTQQLDDAVDKIGLKMNWEVGDFAINDNLGNCHYAPPGTQSNWESAGLRILHRTTIAGEVVPRKPDGRESFVMQGGLAEHCSLPCLRLGT
eukprot:gnl/TRDRNA2_/TRDRNA2_171569_c1_seq5.p1 gnl/TRDRNA2_/TRDRNA2_171569_c1~~gnl/TRDRNA2_/TRDRNA2_171569_c1_seq5.p1  ORF type:complete len:130 (-),score=10.22 gnl/TRDRNA2_/TRDRNA2_171569_c1_seq5:68-457(-)